MVAFGKRSRNDDSEETPVGPAGEDIHSVDDVVTSADEAPDESEELDGPFDIDDFDDPSVAELARLDLGSVLIPMPEAGQLQVELTETGVPSAVWVVTPNGRFTIAAYAAPKTGGLWREVAGELADSLRNDSAKVSIKDGPWGREVVGYRLRCGALHRGRRLPLDDPLRHQRPPRDHGSPRAGGASGVGGHRGSSR